MRRGCAPYTKSHPPPPPNPPRPQRLALPQRHHTSRPQRQLTLLRSPSGHRLLARRLRSPPYLHPQRGHTLRHPWPPPLLPPRPPPRRRRSPRERRLLIKRDRTPLTSSTVAIWDSINTALQATLIQRVVCRPDNNLTLIAMETVKAASLSNRVSSFLHLIPGTTTVCLDFPTV